MYEHEIAAQLRENLQSKSPLGGTSGNYSNNGLQAATSFFPDKIPERSPQISEQLQSLEKEIQFQREVVSMLLGRLQPVLSLAPNEAKGNKSNEPTCPLANALSRLSAMARGNTAELNEIIRRLEI